MNQIIEGQSVFVESRRNRGTAELEMGTVVNVGRKYFTVLLKSTLSYKEVRFSLSDLRRDTSKMKSGYTAFIRVWLTDRDFFDAQRRQKLLLNIQSYFNNYRGTLSLEKLEAVAQILEVE